jgi:carboxylesterase
VADAEMRAANPCMDGVPLASIAALVGLQRHVDGLLPRVRCPSLVVAGALDHTVTVAGARHVARRLAGGARLVVLPRSQHLVGIDVERDRCASEVQAFLDSLPARGPAPGRANQR